MLRAAVNRIYYGMFYMLLALGLKHEFESSKHAQLIGWFNKTFIKEKLIDRKYGAMLREAFEFRQQGDYSTFVEFSLEDIQNKFEGLQAFIQTLEQIIKQ
jgi:uncharacterized protein (UPF0332 family)